MYDGGQLSLLGDVVVVTINHRLNLFGFLYLAELCGPSYADSGNAGMLDCVAALQWVRQNTLWSYEKGRWMPVPVLTGVTDNRETQIVAGAAPGQSFVTGVKRKGGVSIKKAIEMANPTNRSI